MIIRQNNLSGVVPNPNAMFSIGSTRKTNVFSWPLRWTGNIIDLDDLSQFPDLDGDENNSWEKVF